MPKQTFYNLPEAKRERIMQAAAVEFSQRNVQNANLSNIVSAADISRGSLYQYFVDKEDIYVYLFQILRAQRAAYTQPAFALYKKAPFLRFFEAFYVLDSQYLLNNATDLAIGTCCYGSGDLVSRSIVEEIQLQYAALFLEAIEQDKKQGIINGEVESQALADLCVHFVTDMFIFQNVSRKISLEDIQSRVRELLRIIEHGVSCDN